MNNASALDAHTSRLPGSICPRSADADYLTPMNNNEFTPGTQHQLFARKTLN
jgi:hypothetical protein